jgi:hypothetical protein
MSKTIKKFLILFFSIFLIFGIFVLAGDYLVKNKFEKIKNSVSKEDLEKFQSTSVQKINPDEIEKAVSGQIQEFVSPDGKLKLNYSGWIAIVDKKTLDTMSSDKISKDYNVKTILFAQKYKLTGNSAQLIINEGFFKEKNAIEDIIVLMKESSKETGNEMEIIKLESEKNIFEALYTKKDNSISHSLEKIIFNQSKESEIKTYIIAVISDNSNWQDFEKEAQDIISSVQVSE